MPTNRIDSVHIEGIPPINEEMDLTLDPRVNLLIGPNGCGKSTVLRTIVSMLRDPYYWSRSSCSRPVGQIQIDLQHELREIDGARVPFESPSESPIHHYHDERFEDADRIHDSFESFGWFNSEEYGGEMPPDLRIPFVYIPATRLPFPKKNDIVSGYVLAEETVSDDIFDSRRAFRAMDRFVTADWEADLATMSQHELWEFERKTTVSDTPYYEWEESVLPDNLRNAASARTQALLDTTVVCAARICRDVLKPEVLSEHSHSMQSGLRSERGISEVTYPHWLPHTYDNSDDPITIGELSAGTQGPLMWLWHVVSELHDFFVKVYRHRLTHHKYRQFESRVVYVGEDDEGNEENLTSEEYSERGSPPGYRGQTRYFRLEGLLSWEEYRDLGVPWDYCAEPTPLPEEAPDEWRYMPFVLLVDEIENHLHPAWQRRVIPALLETFPHMQLIATTHSPFVVAGREARQVHRLFRDEAGTVRAETSGEDIVGWTVEDILRAFMEIADPTDEDTAVAATVLRWLRNQEPQEGDLAEDWRQERIAQLSGEDMRPSVSDLVALGWLERLSVLSGPALEWWEGRIEHLDEQVSPNLEFQGRVGADRERYIAELEEILRRLEERLGEDLIDG